MQRWTLGPIAVDQRMPCLRNCRLRLRPSERKRSTSSLEAPAKKKMSSKSRCRTSSASLCGKPVFCTSSRGESDRRVTTGTPVSWERVCRASAAAGRASATGMQVKRPRRMVAAFFRNERMRVAVFAAGIVELETRAVGQPDGGNGFVVECRGEFIEALKAASPQGDQFINSNVEDTGRLTQSRLRSGEAYSIGIWKDAGPQKAKKAGRVFCPP